MSNFSCGKCNQIYRLDKTRYQCGVKLVITCAKCSSKNIVNLMPKLIVESEKGQKYMHTLKSGENVIGRSEPNTSNIDIKINDRFVSSVHASLFVMKAANNMISFILVDQKSTNGSFINAETKMDTTKGYVIDQDDFIQMGRSKLYLLE